MATPDFDMRFWDGLKSDGLTTVVDPMVYRCGELFLKGRSQAAGAEDDTWELLQKNVHAVGTFFDRLILDEKLPVFDYADTFDMGLTFDQRTLTRINQIDPVLHEVKVGYDPYTQVRDRALDEVRKVFQSATPLPEKMVQDIKKELAAADYQWNPTLLDLENALTAEQKPVARFLLGGLIFQSYAQIMGGDSVVQPKRSRLFLAVSLRDFSTGHEFEDRLFAELRKRVRPNPTDEGDDTGCIDLPWAPTFFPYLVAKADKLTDLIPAAAALRKQPAVDRYRQWLGEATTDWRKNGRISTQKRNDVAAIAAAFERTVTPLEVPKVEVKQTLVELPKATADLTPWVTRLWGWVVDQLPWNGYRKLLTRATVAEKEFEKLETKVKTLWANG